MNAVTQDDFWMNKALALARCFEGHTRPNPPVGAIVVSDGKAIGTGSHSKAGKPHAEIKALESAGTASRGATLYVTLEPCSSRGRTEPCTKAIIEKRIARVVAAVKDPNPRHRGRGLSILKKAGVNVCVGVCAGESEKLIAPFSKWITTGKPYVTLKMAMSMDGRIADSKGSSKWITCGKSRNLVRALRQRVDAVLVGRRTACIDDPSLLCEERLQSDLYRVIVDSSGRLPANARVLNDSHVKHTIIALTDACSRRKQRIYASKGAQVWELPAADGHVSLKALFRRLGKMEFLHVLCEGGGELANGLIHARLVDEYLFFVAPIIISGRKSAPVLAGRGWALGSGPRVRFAAPETAGNDILIRARPDRSRSKRQARSGAAGDTLLL